MVRKKAGAVSFDHLALEDHPAPPLPEAAPAQGRGRPASGRPLLRDKAAPVNLYLNPAGHKALKLYAVETGLKVHDILMEAVEDWAKRKGIREAMRVEPRD